MPDGRCARDTRRHPARGSSGGAAIIAEIKAVAAREIVALPVIVTSDGPLWPTARDADFRLTRVCKEDEDISICSAMSYNGTRAVLLMQQTGLMDSLNAIRAIAPIFTATLRARLFALRSTGRDRALRDLKKRLGHRREGPLLWPEHH